MTSRYEQSIVFGAMVWQGLSFNCCIICSIQAIIEGCVYRRKYLYPDSVICTLLTRISVSQESIELSVAHLLLLVASHVQSELPGLGGWT